MWKFLIILSIFFAGCSKKQDFIDIDFLDAKFLVTHKNSKNFVFVKKSQEFYKFAMFDIFLKPIDSKIFTKNGEFKSDKFFPPCTKCNEIFYTILKMQKNGKDLLFLEDLEIKKIDLY